MKYIYILNAKVCVCVCAQENAKGCIDAKVADF